MPLLSCEGGQEGRNDDTKRVNGESQTEGMDQRPTHHKCPSLATENGDHPEASQPPRGPGCCMREVVAAWQTAQPAGQEELSPPARPQVHPDSDPGNPQHGSSETRAVFLEPTAGGLGYPFMARPGRWSSEAQAWEERLGEQSSLRPQRGSSSSTEVEPPPPPFSTGSPSRCHRPVTAQDTAAFLQSLES